MKTSSLRFLRHRYFPPSIFHFRSDATYTVKCSVRKPGSLARHSLTSLPFDYLFPADDKSKLWLCLAVYIFVKFEKVQRLLSALGLGLKIFKCLYFD